MVAEPVRPLGYAVPIRRPLIPPVWRLIYGVPLLFLRLLLLRRPLENLELDHSVRVVPEDILKRLRSYKSITIRTAENQPAKGIYTATFAA